MVESLPPGRAGRLWLHGRLDSARRSLELLERKGELLHRELAGLDAERQKARSRWESCCAEAERWGARAAALGGESEVALTARSVAGEARVEIPWRNTMGVLHPGVPQCSLPLLAPVEAAAANAAVAPAAAAAREALEAAVAYSAAERSYRVLEAELRATDRRRRGIEHHRLPALEEALRRLELRLDELEHEEGVVRRWAKGRQEV